MKIRQLLEARKNPDHPAQKKFSGVEPLQKYVDSDEYENLYISYTKVDKVGINPQSPYATPIGIYTYPFKLIWDDLEKSGKMDTVPFAGESPYLMVVKPTNTILVLNDYDNLDNDIAKIDAYIRKVLPDKKPAEIINAAIVDTRSKIPNQNAARIWNISRVVANMTTEGNPAVQWNFILRKILGYSIIQDSGMGLIHPSEKIQTVFLEKPALEVIEKINNTAIKEEEEKPKPYGSNEYELEDIMHILDTRNYEKAYWLVYGAKFNNKPVLHKDELLHVFSKHPMHAFYWSSAIKKPFPAGEAAIASNPVWAARYAVRTLKAPFIRGENAISKNAQATQEYLAHFPDRTEAIQTLIKNNGTQS